MNPVIASLTQQAPSGAGASAVPPWKLDGLKDLSEGGLCETGYGTQNKARKTIQYVANAKHKEKYTPVLAWGITLVPALLDILAEAFYNEHGPTPLRDIPSRMHAALKNKMGNVSTQQLGFVISIVPAYHGARAIKNAIWKGPGFDPSGHTLFKIAQYGMMISIAGDHGEKANLGTPVILYIAVMTIADALMLANTFTNCHTLAEVIAGGAIGVAVLLTAHLIGKHTPLGQWAQRLARTAGEVVSGIGDEICKGWSRLPQLMTV